MKFSIHTKSLFVFNYIISLVLISLPPIYAFWNIMNTHTVAKAFMLASLLQVIICLWKDYKTNRTLINLNRSLMILALIYFFTQSLSFIAAIDTESFLRRYEDTVFSLIFFVNSIALFKIYNQQQNLVVKIFFILAGLNIVIELFLFATLYLELPPLIDNLLHPEYSRLMVMNLNRERIYIENYDEILIPFIFYQLAFSKSQKKTVLIMLFLLIMFCTILSGSRTKLLMLAFSLIGFFFLNIQQKFIKKSIIGITLLVTAVTFYLAISLPTSNAINRVIESDIIDSNTIFARVERWSKGIIVGSKSPLIGVGLGNYYNHLPFRDKKGFSILTSKNEEYELAASYPHNVFIEIYAETGIAGLMSFILLIGYLGAESIKIFLTKISKNGHIAIALITLFIYSLLNPANTIKYQSLFWLFIVMLLTPHKNENTNHT